MPCFMAGLWTVYSLFMDWFGTLFVVVSWIVCGVFYGLTRDCFRTVLWLVCGLLCGLSWDCFGTVFVPYLWLVLWPFGVVLWTLYVSYLAFRIKGVIT